jgi:hypothetical protein
MGSWSTRAPIFIGSQGNAARDLRGTSVSCYGPESVARLDPHVKGKVVSMAEAFEIQSCSTLFHLRQKRQCRGQGQRRTGSRDNCCCSRSELPRDHARRERSQRATNSRASPRPATAQREPDRETIGIHRDRGGMFRMISWEPQVSQRS